MSTQALSGILTPTRGAIGRAYGRAGCPWWSSVRAQAPLAAAIVVVHGLMWLPAVARGTESGLSRAIVAFMGPAIIMGLIVALVALLDARGVQGRTRPWLLAAAAVAGTVAGSSIELALLVGLRVWPAPRYPLLVTWWSNVGEYLVFFPAVVFVQEYVMLARQRATALAEARRQRAIAARRTAEARLQAIQARVDPQFLFDVLATVESLHEAAPKAAERLLDDVTAYLRAAMPDNGVAASTMGREAELARTWLAVQSALWGGRLAVEVDVPDALVSAPFPPMTLVPVLEDALAPAAGSPRPASVRVAANADRGCIAVRVRVLHPDVASAPEGAAVEALRVRLADMYEETASVRSEATADGRETTLSIPVDHAESGHR